MHDYEVVLESVSKFFGKTVAVDNVDLHVRRGEFLTLLGPSGCGKTTTLRIIAGFLKPDRGKVYIRGELVNEKPVYKRNIGMVFQNYALFPHMTVRENVEFGLRMHGVSKEERYRAAKEALRMVNLEGLEDRYPRQLSGGQQQRVALARALVVRPDVLLLDEPLSNLDLKLRVQMRIELKRLQRELGVTTIYVTHDQGESLSMSDMIAVMNNGRIVQLGTPVEIYEKPTDAFVAGFIGEANILEGTVKTTSEGVYVEVKGLEILVNSSPPTSGSKIVKLIARPERLRIINRDEDLSTNVAEGHISALDFVGPLIRYFVKLENGVVLKVDVQNTDASFHKIGDKVKVYIPPENITLIN